MFILRKLFLYFCFLPVISTAQTDSLLQPVRSLQLNYDNDFFSATDRYYTQGIYLKFIFPFIRKSPLGKILIPLNKHVLNDYGIQLEQDVFTPRSIRHDSIYDGERPYAALFFIRHELTSFDSKKCQRLTTQIDLGIIGPFARGEEEQKGIHKALNNIQPLGWQYQLSTDYIINYNILLEKQLLEKKYLEWMATGELKLGTLYDYAGTGTILRLGKMRNYFEGKRRIGQQERQKWEYYFYGKLMGKVVGYNATLQGGLFNKDVYTLSARELKRTVATAEIGLVLSFKNAQLEFTKIYISPEFEKGLYHSWGHCAVSVCF